MARIYKWMTSDDSSGLSVMGVDWQPFFFITSNLSLIYVLTVKQK
jgi:hypothetical protein